MSVISAAQPARVAGLLVRFGQHAVKVWKDPGFQRVLRREGGRFFAAVAKEAAAASLRVRA